MKTNTNTTRKRIKCDAVCALCFCCCSCRWRRHPEVVTKSNLMTSLIFVMHSMDRWLLGCLSRWSFAMYICVCVLHYEGLALVIWLHVIVFLVGVRLTNLYALCVGFVFNWVYKKGMSKSMRFAHHALRSRFTKP